MSHLSALRPPASAAQSSLAFLAETLTLPAAFRVWVRQAGHGATGLVPEGVFWPLDGGGVRLPLIPFPW